MAMPVRSKINVTSTTRAAVSSRPPRGLLPFGARKAGRQLAVAGDHVAHIGRAKQRRIDRRGGRKQRRDGDQPETELAQKRPGGLGQRIVAGASISPVVRLPLTVSDTAR